MSSAIPWVLLGLLVCWALWFACRWLGDVGEILDEIQRGEPILHRSERQFRLDNRGGSPVLGRDVRIGTPAGVLPPVDGSGFDSREHSVAAALMLPAAIAREYSVEVLGADGWSTVCSDCGAGVGDTCRAEGAGERRACMSGSAWVRPVGWSVCDPDAAERVAAYVAEIRRSDVPAGRCGPGCEGCGGESCAT